jgi:signal transduction histidine kinase
MWHVLSISFTAAVAYTLSTFMEPALVITIGVIVLLITSVLIDIFLARPAMAATEFLARAILHVSSENSGTAAPDIATIKTNREFLQQLASYVYDISSKSVMAQYPVKSSMNNNQPPSSQIIQATSSLKSSPLPFFVIDKNRLITEVSQSGILYLQTDREKIVGKPFYDVLQMSFSSDDTLDSWLSFSEAKSVTGSRTWERVKLTLTNQSIKQTDLAVRFSKDDSEGQEIVLVLFDHTEKYGRDDAGASFVSMAVHELRTPLTIMRGYIEVFEDELSDKLDPEQAEFLRNLSVQAQQLGSFVSNIQNLARIEENALELQLKSESWADVLNSALNDMDIRAKVRHKVLKRKIAEDIPMAGVDRITIYEVIVNIVENAIKYTHSEEPITISSYLKEPGWIETTVEDKGIGIPDGLIGHVFDKFYRSHRTSKSVGGTGLGLFISKTVIEAHGGQIWVKSKEGEGTTFGFTVPTYDSIASSVGSSDNKAIERSAHGWIKNHTLYRG